MGTTGFHASRQTNTDEEEDEGRKRSKEQGGKDRERTRGQGLTVPTVGLRVRVSVSLSCLLLVILKKTLVCLRAVVRACSPMCRRRAITSMHSKDHTSTIMQNSFSEVKQDWIETRMKRTQVWKTLVFSKAGE